MKTRFTPPYPKPQDKKLGLYSRFKYGINDWLKVVYKKSYNLKLGEAQVPKCKMFTVGDPVLVDEILKNKQGDFKKHDALNDLLEPLLGKSIFNTNDELWRRQRSMMNEAFTFTHLPRCFNMMCEATDRLVDRLKQEPSSTFIDHHMTHITADIITRTMMSTVLDEKTSKDLFRSFVEYQEKAQKRFMLSLYLLPQWRHKRQLRQQAKRVRSIFSPIIEKRHDEFVKLSDAQKSSYEKRDFLDAMLLAKSPDTQQPFSKEDLVDQIAFVYLAGHETSASSLTWAFYLLSQSPAWQKILYEEISSLLYKEELTVKSVKKLKQLNCFFSEVLRLYPPVSFFMRQSKCPVHWRGKNISSKDVLVISPWLIQRSDNHWKNPHEFDPCRFDMNDAEAQSRCTVHEQSHKQGFLPFSKGNRVCIGAGFAMQEAMIILSKVIMAFEVLPTGHVPEPSSKVTTRPENGVQVQLKPRL